MIKQYIPNFVYEESEILDAVIEAIQKEIDAFEEYKEQRVLAWYLETSSGSDLDRIGLLVGEPRKGRNDEEYRAAIVAKVQSITGTREVLLNLAQSLTDETADVKDHDAGVVEIDINTETLKNITQNTLKKAIDRAKVAGVHVFWNWKVFEPTKDDVNVDETVKFPKFKLDTENIAVDENVNIPLGGEAPEPSEPFVELLENVGKEATVTYTLHELPFRWGESNWNYADWS